MATSLSGAAAAPPPKHDDGTVILLGGLGLVALAGGAWWLTHRKPGTPGPGGPGPSSGCLPNPSSGIASWPDWLNGAWTGERPDLRDAIARGRWFDAFGQYAKEVIWTENQNVARGLCGRPSVQPIPIPPWAQ